MLTQQEQFDREFITATEIVERLGISRSTLTRAIARKFVPAPIRTSDGQTTIWKRKDLEPILETWAKLLPLRNSKGKTV